MLHNLYYCDSTHRHGRILRKNQHQHLCLILYDSIKVYNFFHPLSRAEFEKKVFFSEFFHLFIRRE